MRLIVLFFSIYLFIGNPLFSQERKRLEKDNNFASHLWYGVGAELGGLFASNYLYLSLTPMVGYKITPDFSIGPRLGFGLQSIRQRISSSQILKTTLFHFSEAAFARYKFFKVIFVHGEFELVQYQNGTYDPVTLKTTKTWDQRSNAYAGLGYNSSNGSLGSEIYVLYNFLEDPNADNFPIYLRVGLTYNF